jgi:hypothetical protein
MGAAGSSEKFVSLYQTTDGIAQLVQQWATGWMAGVRFLAGARNFPLPHNVQTSSGAPTALSPGVKLLGHEVDHSPPSTAEVKNGGAIPPISHMASWHRDNSTSTKLYSITSKKTVILFSTINFL